MIDVLQLLSTIQRNESARLDSADARQQRFRSNAIQDAQLGQARDQWNFQMWDRQQDNARADRSLDLQEWVARTGNARADRGMLIQERADARAESYYDIQKQYADRKQAEWERDDEAYPLDRAMKIQSAQLQNEAASLRVQDAQVELATRQQEFRLNNERAASLSAQLMFLEEGAKRAAAVLGDPSKSEEHESTIDAFFGSMKTVESMLEPLNKDATSEALRSRYNGIAGTFGALPKVKSAIARYQAVEIKDQQIQQLEDLRSLHPKSAVITNAIRRLSASTQPFTPKLMESVVKQVENERNIEEAIYQQQATEAVKNGQAPPPRPGLGGAGPQAELFPPYIQAPGPPSPSAPGSAPTGVPSSAGPTLKDIFNSGF